MKKEEIERELIISYKKDIRMWKRILRTKLYIGIYSKEYVLEMIRYIKEIIKEEEQND